MSRGTGHVGGGGGDEYNYVHPEPEEVYSLRGGAPGGGQGGVSIGVPGGAGAGGQGQQPQLMWDRNVGLHYDPIANLHFDSRANLHVDANSGIYYDLMNGCYQDPATGRWLPMYGNGGSYSPSSPSRGMERQWSQDSASQADESDNQEDGYDEDDFALHEVEALMEEDLRRIEAAEAAEQSKYGTVASSSNSSKLYDSEAQVEVIAPEEDGAADEAPLPPFANEIWFPECRDCTCCGGFKHGCKCCVGKSKSCKQPGCVGGSAAPVAPAATATPAATSTAVKLNLNANVFQPKSAPANAAPAAITTAGASNKSNGSSAVSSTTNTVPSGVAKYSSDFDVVAPEE